MTNNLNAVGNVSQPLFLQEVDSVRRAHIKRTEDSVGAGAKSARGKQVAVDMRPVLPTPGKSRNPNYMAILAEAFCKSFDAINDGAIRQTRDLTQLEQLDQTMASSVLIATKESVDKQEKMIKLEEKQAKYAKESEKTSSTISTVMMVLGAVVMLATIASALFDGGLSLAAVPGEVGLLAESGGEAATDAALAAGTVELGSMSTSAELVADTTADATELEGSAEADTTTMDEANETEEEGAKSSKWQKIGMRAIQTVTNGVFGTPMLVTGIQQLQLSKEYEALAQDEKEVGASVAKMQVINSYFQFYQKLVQRSAGVTTEEVNNASEVVETFSKIMGAYQQIPYGLAKAV